MTILPILLSAIALVLAVAAFLKALNAGNSTEAVAGLSAQVGGLRGLLEGIGHDLSASRGAIEEIGHDLSASRNAIEEIPTILRSQEATLQSQGRAMEAMPGAIALAAGTASIATDLRGAKESVQFVVDGIATLRSSQESSIVASTAAIAGLKDAVTGHLAPIASDVEIARETLGALRSGAAEGATQQEKILASAESLAAIAGQIREALAALPARTAEEIAARPSPAPELEELAVAVRDAGALRGDSVRSIADAVSRVSDRLEASAEEGRAAREDAADRLGRSLATLEAVVGNVREALLPLADALKGHGDAVLPVANGLDSAQQRFEEAAVSLRANQVEFAASVGVFTHAAQDLSTGLGAFAREGAEDAVRDPAAVQQALLESLERLLGGFAESLRAALAESDLRHREALVEIAARLPERVG